jgi:hypothetical protein
MHDPRARESPLISEETDVIVNLPASSKAFAFSPI